ncbi:endonuclease/exonuclease/phosphatase family protein [Limimaricola pyoseonensis]|uniref:Uncharacterized conserved protein YafD, endonuclease/exonuclease/phosphatase (EEP) superfamily n=1 Tax=Limimaricola pyoseonensis TaxID=521013 RepID=A0A1G7CST1_9RHOB|nr:endonuclease/exonuclease/phosphatase family protein [Limimaricola pyoseonensis]SDE42291.1 Uncharacterized conserved protein YafD, endonuclease/exonuclease/phosphatase (EEP) superfamily [Limimaricola pyoseonensis]
MRRGLAIAAGAGLALLGAASLLPLLETDAWWVRYLDFPRMQFAGLIVLFWIAMVALGGIGHGAARWLTVLAIAALSYHGWRLWPYQPLAQVAAPMTESCAPGDRISVLVANLRRDNRDAEAVLALLRDAEPDLFLAMETGPWWDEALAPLGETYPEIVQHVPKDATHYGMHLYSKLPLERVEFRFPFASDTPMLFADVLHPAARLRFIGLHPRPPLAPDQPTTLRDATLLLAGREAWATPLPAIVAGDLNAAPWERTARRMLRLGGLVDPRAGRGPMPSFDAQSAWMKWPLDTVLWRPGPGLMAFEILPEVGSDHLPVRAELCLTGGATQHPPAPYPGDAEEAEATFAAARRLGGSDG